MSIGFNRLLSRLQYLAMVPVLMLVSCMFREPEVVIINRIAPEVLVRNPTINGTIWETVLKYDEASTVSACMAGSGNVHFQSIDFYYFCREHASHSRIDSICMCDTSWLSEDTAMFDIRPLWFNYQSISVNEIRNGDFLVIQLTLNDMEPDYSVPGPYGH